MLLTLKDLTFPVTGATLSGHVADPYWLAKYHPTGYPGLLWSLNVECEEREVDEAYWQPSVYDESLHIPVRRWRDLDGRVVEWSTRMDAVTGYPHGSFYVFEHGDISRARIELSGREGARFRLRWEGVCDVSWNDEYGTDVPFSLDAEVVFTGISMNGSEADDDRTFRERLARYLDLDGLVQKPMALAEYTYDDGVRPAGCAFLPAP